MTGPGWALVHVPADTMSLDRFADLTRLHPQLVTRFVALGLLDATRDTAGYLRFAPSQLVVAARVQRLHALLPLNYAAVGLVLDLLERIQDLERTTRRHPSSWTSTG